MITLIGRVLRIHTVLGGVGGCCLPGVRYLTKEKVTAKDKRQWHVPGSVTGTFSESEKSNRSLFSRYKKKQKMSAGPSHALSAQSQAVLSDAFRNGDTLGPSCVTAPCLGLNPTCFGGSPSKTKRESSWASELTLAVRASPPSFGLPNPPHTSSNTRHCLCPLPSWPPRPSSLQGPPHPGLSTPRISCCRCLPFPHLDPNTISETQTWKATLYPRN